MDYNPYEDKKLIALQQKNINAINRSPLARGLSGAGEAVTSMNKAAKGIAAPFVDARERNVDAMNGYPEKNSRLQAFGGKLQQDIGSGNFPKKQAFNPITRPSYAGNGTTDTVGENNYQGPQVGVNPKLDGISRLGYNSTSKVTYNGASGARGSISVMPGQENVPWTNGIEQGNGPLKAMGLNAPRLMTVGQPPVTQESGIVQRFSLPESDGTIGGNIVQRRTAAMMNAINKTNNDADRNSLDERGQNMTADAALRRDLLTGRGQDMTYGIQSAQNQATADHYKAQDSGIGIENQAKQLGLDRSQLMANLDNQIADATDEKTKAALIRRRNDISGADQGMKPSWQTIEKPVMFTDEKGNQIPSPGGEVTKEQVYVDGSGKAVPLSQMMGQQGKTYQPPPKDRGQLKEGDIHVGPDGIPRKLINGRYYPIG